MASTTVDEDLEEGAKQVKVGNFINTSIYFGSHNVKRQQVFYFNRQP